MAEGMLLLILVLAVALIFDYINGFHDAANAIATVVSTGVLPIRTAVLIAGFFNFPVNGGGGLHHLLESVIKEEALGFNVILAFFFTVLAIGALWLAKSLYENASVTTTSEDPIKRYLGGLYQGSLNKWKVDELYQLIIIKPFYAISSLCAQVFDLGGIDAVVNGVGKFVRAASNQLRTMQTGFVRLYGLVMLGGVVAVVAYFVLNVK